MAIVNGYCTLDEMKTWLDITAATYDSALETAIEGASRWIDNHCNRYFWADSTTKYYTALDRDIIIIDDLSAITTLKTDDDGDRVYETVWTASDFDLMPFQQPNNFPHSSIEIAPNGDYTFPSYSKGVEIAGDFGWATVPKDVKNACSILAARYYLRKDSPWGIAGAGSLGEVRLIDKVDRDVLAILETYIRITF